VDNGRPFVAEQLQALVQKNPSDFTTLRTCSSSKARALCTFARRFCRRASPESKFGPLAFLADFTTMISTIARICYWMPMKEQFRDSLRTLSAL